MSRTARPGRWLRGLRDSAEMAGRLDGVQVVAVMDREGDGFDVFREPRRGVALLIRACHNRSLGSGLPNLFEHMRRQPARAFLRICVDRLSARNSTRGQKASQGRKARKATVALRWTRVELPVPKGSRRRLGTEAEALNAVDVFETKAPRDGSDPISWRLLTTLRVETEGDARKVIELYALRWRIRGLAPNSQVRDARSDGSPTKAPGGMERAIAINAVIAWRIAGAHATRANPAGSAARNRLLRPGTRDPQGSRPDTKPAAALRSRQRLSPGRLPRRIPGTVPTIRRPAMKRPGTASPPYPSLHGSSASAGTSARIANWAPN